MAKSEVQTGDLVKGNRLQLIPQSAASLWTDYTWHAGPLDGFGMGFGARYAGNTYGNNAQHRGRRRPMPTPCSTARCTTTWADWITA